MTRTATHQGLTAGPGDVDVHQHLWPPELIDRLRARSRPPYLRGWRLITGGEPPFDVDAQHHDADTRSRSDRGAGLAVGPRARVRVVVLGVDVERRLAAGDEAPSAQVRRLRTCAQPVDELRRPQVLVNVDVTRAGRAPLVCGGPRHAISSCSGGHKLI